MKLITACLSLLVLALPVASANAGSTIENEVFFSESAGMDRTFRIYLPDGYDPEGTREYPVIYFLHGATWSYHAYWAWIGIQQQLDDMIASEVIQPIILVTPDGTAPPWSGSYWTNSPFYGNFEDYVAYDLVDFVDANYKTVPSGFFRGIMGLSMGGYGAMKIGLKHPDRFCGFASHSAVVALDLTIELWLPYMLEEAGADSLSPPYVYDQDGYFSVDMFSMSGAFSPNPDNPPLFVDLPLDEWGEIRPEIMDVWRPHDPISLASELDAGSPPAIYSDCGTNDDFLLYDPNLEFAETLDDLGIAHEFQSFVGGHSDLFPQRFPIGIEFLARRMGQAPSSVDGDLAPEATSMFVRQTDDGAEVFFMLDKPGDVALTVFDVHGREVRRMVDEPLAAGGHTVNWDGTSETGVRMTSGVYFYSLETSGSIRRDKAPLVR